MPRFSVVFVSVLILASASLPPSTILAQSEPEGQTDSSWVGREVFPGPTWKPVADGREDWFFFGTVTHDEGDRVRVDGRISLLKADVFERWDVDVVYRAIVAGDAANAEAWARRAAIRLRNYYYDGALTDIGEALRLEPGKSQYLLIRAKVYIAQNKYEEARLDVETAIEAAPGAPSPHWVRGELLSARRKHAEAVAEFSEALRLDPMFVEVLRDRASSLGKLKDWDRALADIDAAERLVPDHDETIFLKALCLGEKGEIEAALNALDAKLRRSPDSMAALAYRAEMYARQK